MNTDALAYRLPCKFVLHTVGPNRDLHTEEEGYPLLRQSYRGCLEICRSKNIRTVALSAISTGAYRFPMRESAHVALETVRTFMEQYPDALDRVVFNVFRPTDESIYAQLFPHYFPTPR